MKIFHASDAPQRPADAEHFTGPASVSNIDRLSEQPLVNMYRVTFQPSARTAWHAHSGVQLLLVVGRPVPHSEGRRTDSGRCGRRCHPHRAR